MAEVLDLKKHQSVIVRGRFQLKEQGNRDWIATVEQGTKKEDLLEPSFWSHVSSQLTPYDKIEVRWDDGVGYAEFLVLGCDRAYAKLHLLRYESLTTSDVSQSQFTKHEIRWKGPVLKWMVVRLSDEASVRDKFLSREDAEIWLKDYERTTA
jgi:hypothetical protein